MENNGLSDEQAAALLKSASPLEDVFRSYGKRETGHMDDIQDTITDRADTLLNREKELRDPPLYPASAVYAQEHGELDQYFASARANTACRDAIDQTISANNDGYRLNTEPAVRSVVDAFGYDRALYVLANTIQHKEQDGRFSASNKQWAASQHIVPDIDSFGHDRTLEFVVDRAHPGVVDLFTTFLRREYLLNQPLTAEDITTEAKRICEQLQAEPELHGESIPGFPGASVHKGHGNVSAVFPVQITYPHYYEGHKGRVFCDRSGRGPQQAAPAAPRLGNEEAEGAGRSSQAEQAQESPRGRTGITSCMETKRKA